MASQAGGCPVLADEWEYVDGAVVRLILDGQGNGHYETTPVVALDPPIATYRNSSSRPVSYGLSRVTERV